MTQRRADVFTFVHHPEPGGLWCVINVRTNAVVARGLGESEAISLALSAMAHHRNAQTSSAGSLIPLL